MVSSSFHLLQPKLAPTPIYCMTRALTRTNFHSSRLLRVLADFGVVDSAGSGTGFAENLGQWLNLNDAITLRGALDASAGTSSTGKPGSGSLECGSVNDEFTRMRMSMESAIRKNTIPTPAGPFKQLRHVEIDETTDIAAAYEPHRRYYLALQREMDVGVRMARAHVRESLSNASPALRKLACLDSALDGILGEHESKLLATVPWHLEKRFGQLFNANQQTLAETKRTENLSSAMRADGWLARFRKEMESVLLAELDLRLQPTVGLLEALNNENTNRK